MAVREFDGVDDLLALSGGSVGALCNSAYSIVMLVKPTALNSNEAYLGIQVGTSNLLGSLAEGSAGRLAMYTDAEASEDASVGLTASAWQIIGVSKSAGTTAPTFHRKVLGSGSWTHITSATTVANKASTVDRFEIASFLGGGFASRKDCRVATAAVFATALSSANVETVQTTPSTQQLADLGAVALWDLNQASTATAVEDLVGTADQSSLTGTTVVTTDDPSGWTFGLSGGAPAVVRLLTSTGVGK